MKPALTAEEWAERWHGVLVTDLHGQPFGFTREHWREIDRLARAAFPDSDCERILYEVAERIEALLPPESE